MSPMDPDLTSDLSGGVARLERQNRILRLGAVLLVVGAVVAATTAFRASSSPQEISARALSLVDSAGTPTASIRWEDGAIRMVTPLEMPEEQESEVQVEGDGQVHVRLSAPRFGPADNF